MNYTDRQTPSGRYWKSWRGSGREAKIQKNHTRKHEDKQRDNTNVTGKIMEGTLKRKQVEKYLQQKIQVSYDIS